MPTRVPVSTARLVGDTLPGYPVDNLWTTWGKPICGRGWVRIAGNPWGEA